MLNTFACYPLLFLLNIEPKKHQSVIPCVLREVQSFLVEKLSEVLQSLPVKTVISVRPAAFLLLKAKAVNEMYHLFLKLKPFQCSEYKLQPPLSHPAVACLPCKNAAYEEGKNSNTDP